MIKKNKEKLSKNNDDSQTSFVQDHSARSNIIVSYKQ